MSRPPPDSEGVARYCFLQSRVCIPHCMAYLTESKDCSLLVSIESLTSTARSALRFAERREADAQRGAPPAPPSPFGGRL